MQSSHDIDQTVTTGGDDQFDPGEAARVLAQSNRDARRQYSLSPPWLAAFGCAVILVAYGALWLSTRGQHPNQGPSLGIVGLVYAAVVLSIPVSLRNYRRATAGVSGPSSRQQKIEGAAIALSYLGSSLPISESSRMRAT